MTSPRPRPLRHLAAAVLATGALAGLTAGCAGSATGAPSAAQETSVVAPDFTLLGCTYAVGNSVPAGEPKGLEPHFASFSPDTAAGAALHQIATRGGTAMVDGTGVPAGTRLYAGPDTTNAPVATVPSGTSVLVAEPLVWTDGHGGTWFAFFLQCGGPHLYWASLDQIKHQNRQAGDDLTAMVAQLRAAAPYSRTDQASMMPVTVDGTRHLLVWKDTKIKFPVGRGQLISVTN